MKKKSLMILLKLAFSPELQEKREKQKTEFPECPLGHMAPPLDTKPAEIRNVYIQCTSPENLTVLFTGLANTNIKLLNNTSDSIQLIEKAADN